MSMSLITKHLNDQMNLRKVAERAVQPAEPTYSVRPTVPSDTQGSFFSSGVGKTCCSVSTSERHKASIASKSNDVYISK